MRRKLLEVLADPLTGEPLELVGDRGDDPVESGELVSPSSGRRYPIVGGVPRFVPGQDYSASFGLQWNKFSRVQLDSATGASYSRRRFDRETGWTADELAGTWVVDAGCGTGRFAEIAASYGAEVIALDLSSAVDAAQRNLGHRPNVHVVQGDLRHLPLRAEAISFLYSIGVLQHTPDPIGATRHLVEFLPQGARYAFTIYSYKPWTKLYSKYWVRPLTTRMRPDRLLKGIEAVMPVAFPVTSALFPLPALGKVFQFVIPVANYVDHTDLSRELRYQEAVMDTFDMLAPAYDRPVSAEAVETALAPLSDRVTFVSRVPVMVQGVRSAPVHPPAGEEPSGSRGPARRSSH
ncbi:MAG: methyltransferase domain-containing protein [Acidimicrobiales bacterium]